MRLLALLILLSGCDSGHVPAVDAREVMTWTSTVHAVGDSITHDGSGAAVGGPRVQIFADAVAAGGLLTMVGSASSGPNTVSGVTFSKGHDGHDGYTIANIDSNILAWIAAYPCNTRILMIGTNDGFPSGSLGTMVADITALVSKILTAQGPSVKLVLCSSPPINNSGGLWVTVFDAYRVAIAALVTTLRGQGKNIVFADAYTAMLTAGVYDPSLYSDQVHPNAAGMARIGHCMYDAGIAVALGGGSGSFGGRRAF